MLGLFILPLLAITTLVGIVGYIITLNKKFLGGMVISWVIIAVLLLIVSIFVERDRPIKLTKEDIIGRTVMPGISPR